MSDPKRSALASTVGTALEWYDFALYGMASALIFPYVFFPEMSGAYGVLASFATFGVGFFARPFGGLIVGSLGDKLGRRGMLFFTLVLMAVSTTLIGLIPAYHTIGLWAPILLVICRLGQGFAAGGEYSGAVLLSAEHAGKKNRGLFASIPGAGNALGSIIASLAIIAVQQMPKEEMISWGWRIPFVASFVIGIVGIWIRIGVAESPEFNAAKATHPAKRLPLFEIIQRKPRNFIGAFLLSIGPNVTSYLPSAFALTYLVAHVGVDKSVGVMGVMICNFIKFITVPSAGALSDKFGAKKVFLAGAFGLGVLMVPFFLLLNTGEQGLIWLGMFLIYCLCNDAMLGAQAAMLSEAFPPHIRYTGMASSRELAGAIAGGTLPFIAVALQSSAGGEWWPIAVYAISLAILAAIGALLLNQGHHDWQDQPTRNETATEY
ncbi:MFS superfamily permease protein [Sodalis praecaptivus]|uniref:MFS superfamily permease protein n=1 Tax=Sodalis praecaptivus TaxID=1239307 RepID=W0HXX9_9GAMM|nr:MFS transporter [Sodalis praecaptivus]AHF78614.1 MFS superfamily permease protein [Sodalis praecaptivus]